MSGENGRRLRFGNLGASSSPWYQDLAAVVQIAIHPIRVVKQVLFAGGRAGGNLRNLGLVVRAAGALAALGVPPFWIWHSKVVIRFSAGTAWLIAGVHIRNGRSVIFIQIAERIPNNIGFCLLFFCFQKFQNLPVAGRFSQALAVKGIPDR